MPDGCLRCLFISHKETNHRPFDAAARYEVAGWHFQMKKGIIVHVILHNGMR